MFEQYCSNYKQRESNAYNSITMPTMKVTRTKEFFSNHGITKDERQRKRAMMFTPKGCRY